MNGTSNNAPRMEVNTKSPIDCAKYFSSLSRTCANAEFGAVITRKITFGSKYKADVQMHLWYILKFYDYFIVIFYIVDDVICYDITQRKKMTMQALCHEQDGSFYKHEISVGRNVP